MNPFSKHKRLLIILAVILMIGISIDWLVTKNSTKQLTEIPPVAFSFPDGKKPTLADYRGKVVLGVFWSVSCEICASEIPHLNALYSKHKQKNFALIGIDMPYDRPDWTIKFIKENLIQYPVSFDLNGDIARAFGGIQATPTTFLIDKKGRIVWKKLGRTNFTKLEKQIQSLEKES